MKQFIMERVVMPMEYPNVCALCEEGDLSRQELAGYLQISRGSYTNYEIGARGIPAEVFIKLADYYNVSVDYLMGRTKNPKKE